MLVERLPTRVSTTGAFWLMSKTRRIRSNSSAVGQEVLKNWFVFVKGFFLIANVDVARLLWCLYNCRKVSLLPFQGKNWPPSDRAYFCYAAIEQKGKINSQVMT